jgi:hypothetical protein
MSLKASVERVGRGLVPAPAGARTATGGQRETTEENAGEKTTFHCGPMLRAGPRPKSVFWGTNAHKVRCRGQLTRGTGVGMV